MNSAIFPQQPNTVWCRWHEEAEPTGPSEATKLNLTTDVVTVTAAVTTYAIRWVRRQCRGGLSDWYITRAAPENRPGVRRAAVARVERYGIEAQPEPGPLHTARCTAAARAVAVFRHGLLFLLLRRHFRQSGGSRDDSYSSLCDCASAAFPAVCKRLLCVGEPPIQQFFECESCSLPRCCRALRA